MRERQAARQKQLGNGILQFGLNRALERPRAAQFVESAAGQPIDGLAGDVERNPSCGCEFTIFLI